MPIIENNKLLNMAAQASSQIPRVGLDESATFMVLLSDISGTQKYC